ncbi:MAG: lamin tail domain-containing protein [Elusimicrobia bacterium]|nr:lamin tail domain-containing protein [Elusimicrobiota bacterium]
MLTKTLKIQHGGKSASRPDKSGRGSPQAAGGLNKIKFISLLYLLIFFIFYNHSYSAVVINEFVYDAVGSDTGLEWIELYNNGTSDVDLTDWTIEKAGDTFSLIKTIPSGTIPAGGYFLIEETEAATSAAGNYISGTMALQNGGTESDGIRIKNASGIVQDTVLYDSPNTNNLQGDDANPGAELCPDVLSGHSLSRTTAGVDNNLAADFEDLAVPTPQASELIPVVSSGTIYGKITEVAPAISAGDFIEIYSTAACVFAGGCKIYEGTNLIKTFSDDIGSVPSDMVMVLWASKSNTPAGTRGIDRDETSADENGNGYIDLYSDESTPGLTGTCNNFTLMNSSGTIIDFISFAREGYDSYTGSETSYDSAVTAGQWLPSAATEQQYLDGSVAFTGSSAKSLCRLAINNLPVDRNTKSDWTESSPTVGYGDYGISMVVTSKTLEVFQSPFSPYNDGTYTQAKFSYCLGGIPGDYQLTLQVFDIRGRNIKVLLDSIDAGGGSTTVSWDGRDDNGNIVRTGIYIVHLEAINKTTGSSKRSSKRVVVARKM